LAPGLACLSECLTTIAISALCSLSTGTAEGLKSYIKDYCMTAVVQPPLSSLFKVPTDPNNAAAGGSFCRDNGCRLERRYGGLPAGAVANGTQQCDSTAVLHFFAW
jgi:hypothetical protein